MESKEWGPTPLEASAPMPVWVGDEESTYVPKGLEKYYNTDRVMIGINNKRGIYRKHKPEYMEYWSQYHAWLNDFADYNGYATRLREQLNKREEEQRYYRFELGEEGRKNAHEFIDKMENGAPEEKRKRKYGAYSYRYVIYPTELGEVCYIEAYNHGDDKNIVDRKEVYNQI